MKLLQWDRDGFWLHSKRLERGTFRFAVDSTAVRHEISRAQLSMLIEGIDLQKRKIREPLSLTMRRNDNGSRA